MYNLSSLDYVTNLYEVVLGINEISVLFSAMTIFSFFIIFVILYRGDKIKASIYGSLLAAVLASGFFALGLINYYVIVICIVLFGALLIFDKMFS